MVRSATLSPRASSRSRSPPETRASTTSLTVPLSVARTAFTSLRRTCAQLQVRCGPTGPTNDEPPSGRSTRAPDAMPRTRSRAWSSVARGARAAALKVRSCSDGFRVRCVRVRSTSSAPLGSGSASQAPPFAAASPPNMIDIRSVAETPSTMQ